MSSRHCASLSVLGTVRAMWREALWVAVGFGFLYELFRRARGGESFLRSLFWDVTSIRDLHLDDRDDADDRRPFDLEA